MYRLNHIEEQKIFENILHKPKETISFQLVGFLHEEDWNGPGFTYVSDYYSFIN